jgi:predicted SAM-dependent methyltransferase
MKAIIACGPVMYFFRMPSMLTSTSLKQLIPPRKRYLLRQAAWFIRSMRYAGNSVYCPCCNRHFGRFIRWDPSDPKDDNYVCPNCSSQSRHRLLWHFLNARTRLFTDRLSVLHFAPELFFWKKFRRQRNLTYIPVDLLSNLADAKLDIQHLPFVNFAFDVIICNHVLEHVLDDHGALAEMYRVMSPGGWAAILVPIDSARETTYEDQRITTPAERLRHFGQDDHVRICGRDYSARMESAGFMVETVHYAAELPENVRQRYKLMQDEDIFVCRKG